MFHSFYAFSPISLTFLCPFQRRQGSNWEHFALSLLRHFPLRWKPVKMSPLLQGKTIKNWGHLKGLAINILVFHTRYFLASLEFIRCGMAGLREKSSLKPRVVVLSCKGGACSQRWADLSFPRKGGERGIEYSNFTFLSQLCTQFIVK